MYARVALERERRYGDFDSHYRYVSANETIRTSPTGLLMDVRLYLTRKNMRLVIAKSRKIAHRDRTKAKGPAIIIAPVNLKSRPGRCNPIIDKRHRS